MNYCSLSLTLGFIFMLPSQILQHPFNISTINLFNIFIYIDSFFSLDFLKVVLYAFHESVDHQHLLRHLLDIQNLKSHSRPAELDYVFQQDFQLDEYAH